jgi:adenosylcobinamide kinase / adenosylcobinamide-phosphate guanylyltransferase
MKVLVTGGVWSGKSTHAEYLLRGEPAVTYVAPGPTPDEGADPDWAARFAAHRARRPDHWETLETHDLAAAPGTDGAVLVDCLGTWLTAVVDDAGLWDASPERVHDHVSDQVESAVAALSEAPGRSCWSPTRWASASCPSTARAGCSATCWGWPTSASAAPATRCTWWSPGGCCGCEVRPRPTLGA